MLKPWDLQSCTKKLAYVLVLISAKITAVEVSMNCKKVNTFVYIFADRLYTQVTFWMLPCARKPSTSVTVVSHLIKYDYSVIELYNVMFGKTDAFSA